jgi:hypothetical protein
MVEATNKALLAVNGVRTTFGELLRYIGMMMLMSCYIKLPDYFWRTAERTGDCSEDKENDMPSFTFNRYMSRRRYAAHIGFAVYNQTTAIVSRQVLADSGFDLGVERAHADNLRCSVGFMPRRVNVHLEQPMDLPRVGVLSTETMAIW